MTILVNGIESASVDARDRGLQFGDGVFETLLLREGRPVLWGYHWERLCLGLDRLGIPRVREQACLDDLSRVAVGAESMAKLIVTRGPGPRGYRVPAPMRPTRVVMGGDPPVLSEQPEWLRVGVCGTRVAANPVPGCKHLNRIENVLARMEWKPDWDEGLMLDRRDNVVGGTQGNLFALEGSALVTPPVLDCGIAGTRRRWLIERAAAEGLVVREEVMSLGRVRDADAVFLTNSRIGLRPARLAGGHATLKSSGDATDTLALLLQFGKEMNEMD